jgi:hypothetical protein
MNMRDKTLVVIYGQVRTFEITSLSIYQKIVLENFPCHVVLAIDGKYSDIPLKTMKLFEPYLLDIYTTDLKEEEDIPRDHNRIEFVLVKNVLDRLTPLQKEQYRFMIKVRTDLYAREGINIQKIYCTQSLHQFKKDWEMFVSHSSIKNLSYQDKLKAWIMTSGGFQHFVKQYDPNHIPTSPWSLSNVIQWNRHIWDEIHKLKETTSQFEIHKQLRHLFLTQKIVYLIGSSWIHYGYFDDIDRISKEIYDKYGTYRWTDDDNEILEWIDHKGEKRMKLQKEWRWITDDQLRLCHTKHYGLIDLVNPKDYIESFDSWHSLNENIKNLDLFVFIVRPHSIHKT